MKVAFVWPPALIASMGGITPMAVADQPAIATVMLSGQPVFGGPAGERFSEPSSPRINSHGAVVFRSITQPQAGGQSEAIYRWQSGTGLLAAHLNSPIPDQPTFQYRSFTDPVIDSSGRVGFTTTYDGSTVSIAHMYGELSQLRTAAIYSQTVPGALTLLTRTTPMRTNPSGVLSFTQTTTPSRFWTGTPGSLREHLPPGTRAPGYQGVFVQNPTSVETNDAGEAIALCQMSGGTYTGSRIVTLSDGMGSVFTIAGPGMPAPGLNATLAEVGDAATMNRNGIVCFNAAYQTQLNGDFQYGVWVGRQGSFTPVATSGQSAPGMPGFQFAGVDAGTVNASGNVAFHASATATGASRREGLWTWSGGEQRLAVALGMPVQNLPDGVVLQGMLGATSGSYSVAFNDRQQFALLGTVGGSGISTTLSLMATDLAGSLVSIAAVGRPFEVGVGDVRTVADIRVPTHDTSGPFRMMSSDSNHGTFFNDAGELAFTLRFTNGTWGTFVAQVPTPSTPMLAAVGILLNGLVRRNRRSAIGG